MRTQPANIFLLVTGHALVGSNEFHAEHRECCQRKCRTHGFTHPSRQEDDGDDGCDRYREEPSASPRRGRSASRSVRRFFSGLFFLTQRSTLENESRKPVIGSSRNGKYRDPNVSLESSMGLPCVVILRANAICAADNHSPIALCRQ